MTEAYHMVFVNIITLSFTFFGVIFYRYIYPKKPINLFYLLILISILPVISVLRPGVYESGDFNLHIYRTISFFSNLQHFQFIPSWASGLNAEFGYPLFIFINPLPYYFISFFHFLGFTFISSMKLFLITSFVLSSLAMFFFSRRLFQDEKASLVAAIFYSYSPYHLIDMHFRIDIGEIIAYLIFPICCLYLFKTLKEKNNQYFIILGIFWGFLILSHQAIALIAGVFFLIFVIFYFIANGFQREIYLRLLLSGLIGISISAFSWVPYFFYIHYTLMNLTTSFSISLLSFNQLLFSKWRMGFLFQGPQGQLAYILGYAQIFVLITISALLFLKKVNKENKRIILFFTGATFVLCFMMINQSRILWEIIPLIKNILISSRLLFFTTFTTSILAGYLILSYKKNTIFITLLIIFAVGSTTLNWGNRKTIPAINDFFLISNLGKSTYEGEGLGTLGVPRWTGNKNKWMTNEPENSIETKTKTAQTINFLREPTLHSYLIFVSSDSAEFVENTWYFPGWNALANGKKIDINYTNPEHPGIITFSLPKGIWKLDVYYDDTPVLKLTKIFSLCVFFSLLLILIFQKISESKVKKIKPSIEK